MPNLPPYSYNGPIDHTAPINESQLKDKCIIITGGSNGIGAELVRQFSMTGAFVTFGDVNQENGELLEAELNSKGNNVQFVQCNVTSWDDQINLFERAVERSPSRSCDIVIANAGISRSSGDSLWKLDSMFVILPKCNMLYLSFQQIQTSHQSNLS
jgi:NAD(P)-dependent dehydrogenase (short-subunit alcohol dehydrogenase family)